MANKTGQIWDLYYFTGQVSIGKGIDGWADPSAWLELGADGTNKGLLLPRLASTASILTPKEGLFAYDKSDKKIKYYDGTAWQEAGGGGGSTNPGYIWNQNATSQAANFWINGNGRFGNASSVGTTATVNIDLGGTYSTVGGANLKLKLYNDGSLAYGFGVSVTTGASLDYVAPAGARHNFYIGTSAKMQLNQVGNLMIGTASDNGGVLQVAGGVTSTAPLASPPVVINGGLYYDSANNKEKVGVAGAWKNIATEENPTFTGTINSTVSAAPNLTIRNTSNSSAAAIQFFDDANTYIGQILYGNSGSSIADKIQHITNYKNIQFSATNNSSQQIIISPDDKVLFGTLIGLNGSSPDPAIGHALIRYESTTTKFRICNGTSWQNIATEGNTTLQVSDYADNAAALAAGLTVGRVYKTGDILKIVH